MKQVERDYFGNIVSYTYMGYHFLSLKEAELLKEFHHKNKVHDEYFAIKRWIWPIGMPKFVDIETSLRTSILTFHKIDDIDISYPNLKDFEF